MNRRHARQRGGGYGAGYVTNENVVLEAQARVDLMPAELQEPRPLPDVDLMRTAAFVAGLWQRKPVDGRRGPIEGCDDDQIADVAASWTLGMETVRMEALEAGGLLYDSTRWQRGGLDARRRLEGRNARILAGGGKAIRSTNFSYLDGEDDEFARELLAFGKLIDFARKAQPDGERARRARRHRVRRRVGRHDRAHRSD